MHADPEQPTHRHTATAIAIIVFAIVAICAAGAYAFVSKYKPKTGTGTVIIHAYDVTGNTEVSLADVNVHIQPVNAPTLKCAGPTLVDSSTGSPNISSGATGVDGIVKFTGCATGSKRTKQYNLRYFGKSGYISTAGNSLHQNAPDGKPHGRFSVRGRQTTKLSIYLQTSGTSKCPVGKVGTPPNCTTPPPSSGVTPDPLAPSPNNNTPVPCGSIAINLGSPPDRIGIVCDLREII